MHAMHTVVSRLNFANSSRAGCFSRATWTCCSHSLTSSELLASSISAMLRVLRLNSEATGRMSVVSFVDQQCCNSSRSCVPLFMHVHSLMITTSLNPDQLLKRCCFAQTTDDTLNT